ncbi:Rdx family protein [Corallococcus sp. NCSPR001]|nr:Rdx family protein [Corallococcus sp. NCSPR001]
MKDELEVDVELKKGGSGVFEVAVDGKVVIKKTGLAFPAEQEVVDAVFRALKP